MSDFWSCSGGSNDAVLWVPIYGRKKRIWHKFTIIPLYRIGRRLSIAKYWLYYRLRPKHQHHIIRTGLEPGYYDEDVLILHGCFAMLERFVEWHEGVDVLEKFTQELGDRPDPNAPEGINSSQIWTQSEAIALYRWWKIEKPADEAARETAMTAWHEGRGKQETEARWEALQTIERKIDEDEQAMLHRLIDIRRRLWT